MGMYRSKKKRSCFRPGFRKKTLSWILNVLTSNCYWITSSNLVYYWCYPPLLHLWFKQSLDSYTLWIRTRLGNTTCFLIYLCLLQFIIPVSLLYTITRKLAYSQNSVTGDEKLVTLSDSHSVLFFLRVSSTQYSVFQSCWQWAHGRVCENDWNR